MKAGTRGGRAKHAAFALSRAYLVALLVGVLLSGCAVVPELAGELAPAQGFALTARIGVRAGTEGFSGGVRWVHEPRQDRIEISSLLGQMVAQIEFNAQGAALQLPERKVQSETLSELMQREMGWVLPLEGLADWVRALPRRGVPFEAERDDAGRLLILRQDGWVIEYQRYFESVIMTERPSRLVLRRGDLELRLVIDSWARDSGA